MLRLPKLPLLFGLVTAGQLLNSATAFAEDSGPSEQARVELAWVRLDGAESCSAQDSIEAKVTERLGYDPFESSADQRIEGVIQKTESGWLAHLYERNEKGETVGRRELSSEAEDCSSMNDAVALALALAIDGEAALAAKEPAKPKPKPKPAPPPKAAPKKEPPAPVEPPPSPPQIVQRDPVFLGLGASFLPGVLPQLGWGVEFSSEITFADWSVLLGMNFAPEKRTADDIAEFGVGLTTGLLGACRGLGQQAWFVSGCAGAHLGAIHSVVFSPQPVRPGDRFYAATAVQLRARVQLFPHGWLGAHGGAQIPMTRYEYFVEDQDEAVFKLSPLAPDLGVRLLVEL